MFLDSVREKQQEEERQRKEKDGEEIKQFKQSAPFLPLLTHTPDDGHSELSQQGLAPSITHLHLSRTKAQKLLCNHQRRKETGSH